MALPDKSSGIRTLAAEEKLPPLNRRARLSPTQPSQLKVRTLCFRLRKRSLKYRNRVPSSTVPEPLNRDATRPGKLCLPAKGSLCYADRSCLELQSTERGCPHPQ